MVLSGIPHDGPPLTARLPVGSSSDGAVNARLTTGNRMSDALHCRERRLNRRELIPSDSIHRRSDSPWLPTLLRGPAATYSHSIVLGGFELTSYTTRFTPRTELMIRVETRCRSS